MRFLKMLGLLLFLSVVAMASGNKLGINDVRHVKFDAPVRIGTDVLPAGEYVVRHTMQGEEHIMAFERANRKEVYKVKCTLVPLTEKADADRALYTVTSSEKVLRELIFRGDTAKHVF